MLDTEAIEQLIPHRPPLLLVDRILEREAGVRGVGLKCVSVNEPFFQGHFPGAPIMPGTLIVECMAQVAAAVLGEEREGEVPRPAGAEVPPRPPQYLGLIERMKFRRPVVPGDCLRVQVEVRRRWGPLVYIHAEATVEGEVVASGELTLVGPEVQEGGVFGQRAKPENHDA